MVVLHRKGPTTRVALRGARCRHFRFLEHSPSRTRFPDGPNYKNAQGATGTPPRLLGNLRRGFPIGPDFNVKRAGERTHIAPEPRSVASRPYAQLIPTFGQPIGSWPSSGRRWLGRLSK